jgi:hypothetical protein
VSPLGVVVFVSLRESVADGFTVLLVAGNTPEAETLTMFKAISSPFDSLAEPNASLCCSSPMTCFDSSIYNIWLNIRMRSVVCTDFVQTIRSNSDDYLE